MKKDKSTHSKNLMNLKNNKCKEIHIKTHYNTLSKAKDKDRILKVTR